MRILVYDHAGHPFQVQLSRALAIRGHHVLHTYCASVKTPHGALEKSSGDPDNFDVTAIHLAREFQRYGLISRWQQEKELGLELAKIVHGFSPDVIVSANTPLRVQSYLIKACRVVGAKFIFWVQDLLSIGITNALRTKISFFGFLIGRYFHFLENHLLKKSDHVVLITEDHLPLIPKQIITHRKTTVIENWAPLDEISIVPKENSWSKKYQLEDKFCYLYSGTLGMKHNPELLIKLALALESHSHTRIVVISEGIGSEYLEKRKQEHELNNLIVIRFQSYHLLSQVLGTADVLLAFIEPDAGIFAVPSKVLTYLCAKKPLLIAIPKNNLAARIVADHKAGIVVSPRDEAGFINAAIQLKKEKVLRSECAKNGWNYAQENFDIEKKTDAFESILLN